MVSLVFVVFPGLKGIRSCVLFHGFCFLLPLVLKEN